MITSPFEQFKVNPILNLFWNNSIFSITNATIYTFLILISFIIFIILPFVNPFLVPTRWQIIVESIFNFIYGVLYDNVGTSKLTLKYINFIITLFFFVLFGNLIGMAPYSFTITSHISVTFYLSSSVCLALLILGIQLHKIAFLRTFFPQGAPLNLSPLIIGIEFLSYLSHAFSLAIRLFANMLAGHALLKILTGFLIIMAGFPGLLSLAFIGPFSIVFALTFLELGIAMLQAYVFCVLTCIYLKDTVHLH